MSNGRMTRVRPAGPPRWVRACAPAPGTAVRSAAINPSRNRTGSLSPRSRDSHAHGRVSSAAESQSASSVVFPDPTGAWTSASFAWPEALRSSISRVRRTRAERAPGIWIFVAARTALNGADATAVGASEAMWAIPEREQCHVRPYTRRTARNRLGGRVGTPSASAVTVAPPGRDELVGEPRGGRVDGVVPEVDRDLLAAPEHEGRRDVERGERDGGAAPDRGAVRGRG